MKKYAYFLVIAVWFGLIETGFSTHIVGGDVQMQYLGSGNRYRFIVNLYFDEINGNQEAEDPNIVLGIYRRRNNTLVQSFTLPKTSQSQVQYQNDACQSQFLRTRLIRYSLEVDLSPSNYNEQEGYYAVWDRCCRNNVITNIVSPGSAGSVFYLWFPAIQIGGSPFRNNSPAFSIPNGDYLCLGQNFSTTNFAATDADGDQLIYSMATPFNGYSSTSSPNPFSAGAPSTYGFPPPTINWQPGYSATNAIPSSVGMPLSIDSDTGILSVNPNRTGLFVFAIRCEEFRNGTKIGESRREFQFLVRECRSNTPPVVSLPLPHNPSQNYVPGDTLTIDAANDANLCFNFKITDSPNENITRITAVKVSGNFNFRNN
ncbi:MAG: gliding motility-associated C-terminal domain-containing protein, partial [Raineya sp.]|nr:gliding motility-associated C-terminal domain-containing protein [Raineya sp.]